MIIHEVDTSLQDKYDTLLNDQFYIRHECSHLWISGEDVILAPTCYEGSINLRRLETIIFIIDIARSIQSLATARSILTAAQECYKKLFNSPSYVEIFSRDTDYTLDGMIGEKDDE